MCADRGRQPTGVRTADGELHAVDVVVYATGFDAGKVLAPMSIRGRSRHWFKNADGRIVTNSPWRIVDYWAMSREPDFSDYVVHAASPR